MLCVVAENSKFKYSKNAVWNSGYTYSFKVPRKFQRVCVNRDSLLPHFTEGIYVQSFTLSTIFVSVPYPMHLPTRLLGVQDYDYDRGYHVEFQNGQVL